MPRINFEQVDKIADVLKKMPDEDSGLNFYSFRSAGKEIVASNMYPEFNHPEAINFFFFVCLHQYGFWHGDANGYSKPLYGQMNGKQCKGSDLLWKATKKALDKNPLIFNPTNLAKITKEILFSEIFIDDNGPIKFADTEMRWALTHACGRWFLKNYQTPKMLVLEANREMWSLRKFLFILHGVPGYSQDILEKKNMLLAMTLANRPEKFLKATDSFSWKPIVDYHLMRLALRLGLVNLNELERNINIKRKWVTERYEQVIRAVVYRAIELLIDKSEKSMSFIDEKMWGAHRYCPEMEKPDCAKCIFNTNCKKNIELFQPVFRTTAY